MNRNLQRITAALLLGCYGLAVSVSGAFHTHRFPIRQSCAPGYAERGHESSCRAHYDHDLSSHSVHDSRCDPHVADTCPLGINSHGDECAVCSFLAHKPVQTTSPDAVTCTYLAQALVHLKAVSRVEDPFSAIYSRGPPPVA